MAHERHLSSRMPGMPGMQEGPGRPGNSRRVVQAPCTADSWLVLEEQNQLQGNRGDAVWSGHAANPSSGLSLYSVLRKAADAAFRLPPPPVSCSLITVFEPPLL